MPLRLEIRQEAKTDAYEDDCRSCHARPETEVRRSPRREHQAPKQECYEYGD